MDGIPSCLGEEHAASFRARMLDLVGEHEHLRTVALKTLRDQSAQAQRATEVPQDHSSRCGTRAKRPRDDYGTCGDEHAASVDSCKIGIGVDPVNLKGAGIAEVATQLTECLDTALECLGSLDEPESKAEVRWIANMRRDLDRAMEQANSLTEGIVQGLEEPSDAAVLKGGIDMVRQVEEEVTNVGDCKSSLTRRVRSGKFEILSATVIVLNAVAMGISTDHNIDNMQGADSEILSWLEITFFLFYAIEVILRIVAFGRRFFIGPDWRWNWFDMFLVVMPTYEWLQTKFLEEGAANILNLSVLRMLRLLKMMKLLRIIRLMRMFKELRLLLTSILGSVNAMSWALLLIFLMSYMASVCFVNVCTMYVQDNLNDASLSTRSAIEEHWNSVGKGMNTLFAATTGGMDWLEAAEPLHDAGFIFYYLFILYIAFFMFVILNTVTSLFVEQIMECAQNDQEAMVQKELETTRQCIKELKSLFQTINGDEEGGTISFAEFCQHADHPQLIAFAAAVGIDISDTKEFFSILSNDGEWEVDSEAFVVGCIKLKGQAQRIDVQAILQFVKKSHTRIEEMWLLLHSGFIHAKANHHEHNHISQAAKVELPDQRASLAL